jgi:hypothetical protein
VKRTEFEAVPAGKIDGRGPAVGIEKHPAGRRFDIEVERFDNCAFAGPALADDTHDFPGIKIEGHLLAGDHRIATGTHVAIGLLTGLGLTLITAWTVVFGQVTNRQKRLAGRLFHWLSTVV